MSLVETLSPTGTMARDTAPARSPDRVARTAARDDPLPAVPQDDPIEAQKILCQEIALLARFGLPELAQLDALFALERQGQPVGKLLLARYVEGDGKLRSCDWQVWQAAIRLTKAFHLAYDHFLRHIRGRADENWTRHEPLVVLQLFHHRKVEFLLRMFRYKKRNVEQWRELHAIYRRVREAEIGDQSQANDGADTIARTAGRLEQQYLQILLLEVMNSGQFSPREVLWAHRWFARWCNGPGLKLTMVEDGARERLSGFVIDLDGSDGLQRAPIAADNLLYLDSAPLCAMIDQERASLRDGAAPLRGVQPAVRAGQLALLNKLAVLFAPIAPGFTRRGERTSTDQTVQAIAGFPFIIEELRKERQRQGAGSSQRGTAEPDTTMSSFGVQTQSLAFGAGDDGGPISLSMTALLAAIPQSWQVKDRSDSGCRMRGQVDNLNRVIPGSLIAIRDSAAAPWMVAVVRRFRRLMVDHVEIGVEYLGRKPRFVKLVADADSASAAPGSAARCFAALFLPPSDRQPTMPIKTLLLPARDFKSGSVVTLLSSNATYRMRLNEPLQQQFEFVLTSFSVIEKSAAQVATVR